MAWALAFCIEQRFPLNNKAGKVLTRLKMTASPYRPYIFLDSASCREALPQVAYRSCSEAAT